MNIGIDLAKNVFAVYSVNYRVPDDSIDFRRYPLFMARDVMRGLIEQLKAEERTAP